MTRSLALLPVLTLLAMLGPILAGLIGTLLPAVGIMPVLGHREPEFSGFGELLAWQGLPASIRLSITVGLASTTISLAIVALFVAGWAGTRAFSTMERVLSPLLAVPHAAAAFGLAFLIAPSGWILRALAPILPGLDRPPDILIPGDPYGLAIVAGLVLKEVPFLLLMTLSAMGQSQTRESAVVASALGYGRVSGWLKTVFPRVYAQIRLPIYVTLAFSMSVVDVAIILGPTTPPTLAVQIVAWINDPDLSMRIVASAAASFQLAITLAVLALWRMGEMLVARLGCRWVDAGQRWTNDWPARISGFFLAGTLAIMMILGLMSLAIWSVAALWTFPDLLPQGFSLRSWTRHAPDLGQTAMNTAIIALAATGIALVLVIGCLEAEHRRRRPLSPTGLKLIYLPLIVPQIAFLPGLQTGLLLSGGTIGYAPVIIAHLVFVLPYVFLSLGDPWRAWDPRRAIVATALGAGPWRVLWAIRLPMLLRPILIAAALGIAVSVGQYLPTLLIGGGRIPTLTTEAVALVSGGDRRAIGIFGISQTIAALVPFAIAIGLPVFLMRNRRGLHV